MIKLEWFGHRTETIRYLSDWQSVPVTYQRGHTSLDLTWHIDDYQECIGSDETGRLLTRAADLLWRYRFYPDSVLTSVSHFSSANRPMRVGDRLVQRIHLPVFDVITMNEISCILDEPRCKGFAYATTAAHAELGEWQAQVNWRKDNSVWLIIHSESKALLPWPLRWYARRLQKRAHRAGIAYFKSRIGS
jgi:uncharacterized protein (UPF0548 family)